MKSNQPKIAVIGGGSGISVILRGLKQFTSNITAIVAVSDDGGSSGIIREDLNMLPPGDIRNCIVALSNVEPVMAKIMQHRFKSGQFSGHALGNIIIAGLTDIEESFERALLRIHDIFAVTGRVLPVSLDDIVLSAELKNGVIIRGESNIPNGVKWYKQEIVRVFIEPSSAEALPQSIAAIMEADIVLLGPGSLYTSVIPSLLIKGINKALRQTEAKVVMAMNLMTQAGETDGMDALDHFCVVKEMIGSAALDYLMVNNKPISAVATEKYAAEHAHLIHLAADERTTIENEGVAIIEDAFLEEYAGYVRHNAEKFSMHLIDITDH